MAFLAGGEMAALMRAHDWSTSPLGHPTTWPQSLRSIVGLVLGSKFPMFVAWGKELGFLYNDAYAEVLGAKHPTALGRRFRDIWAEIWPEISPLIDAATAGEASYRENLPLLMNRKGYDEKTWFTFSYSPVWDESGQVAGMFCVCKETTEQVLGERRQVFRLDLEERLRALDEPRAVMDAAVEALGRYLAAIRVGYSEVRADDETIDCHSCFADGVAPILGTFRLADFGPDSIERQRRGQTEIACDIQADPAQVQETWTAIETRAYVSVPLIREGRFTASLYVNHRRPHRWTPEEVALIEEVAARTWDAVERARAEASLRESEARFRLMADAVPQIVWITDPEGRAEFFNRQWMDYTGATDQPATAADVAASFVHPDDRAATMAAYDEARRTGGTFLVEHRIRSAAGDWRWFLVRGEPYRDPGTCEITHWFGASVDIHDRKLAEGALRESEARLRLATEAAEVGFWDVDPLRDELVWPPRVKTMFGISADRPVSMRDFYAGLHPDDREATTEAFAAAMDPDRRALYDVEYRTIGKEDGRIRWVAAKGRGVFDDKGRCIRVIGSAIDVTARKAIEERLRELNDTLEAQVAARTAERDRAWRLSQDILAAVAPDGAITALNASWTRLLGWEVSESMGLRFAELTHPEDLDETLRVFESVFEAPLSTPYEFRLRHKDGSYRWFAWTAAFEDSRVYASGRDVTAEKERQAELETAQEQLRQSQKMEAMGQLTGGVAHDFNNLLTPIIGSLDRLMTRGVGSERERRLMAGALESAERAKVLVQRLLAFARRQPLQPGPVDLSRLVSGMAELIASTSGPRVDVRVELPEDLPPARADANQLEMALLNLAVNARDAMPDGGMLAISAARESVRDPRHRAKLRAGHYVRLSVRDTGTGMDEATLARAVEPFFSTKGVGRGTGLGLSMVHGLASQLGGGLSISSSPGQGTTVELWLPISPVAVGEDAQDPGPAAASEGLGTALLVDDEDLVRLSTADMLTDMGYEVVEARSAEEALRLMAEGLAPDLVVTDHLMPGLTGVDLARDLRARRPELPVLIVSGYAEMDGIAPGFPRLTKPFRAAELSRSLAALKPEGAL